MAGEVMCHIGDKSWQCYYAVELWELQQGLGGVEAIPSWTGMLFDLGYDQYLNVTTVPMLFNLDIAFISSELKVVDLATNVPPGQFLTSAAPGRFFLEVNAGEMEGISVGDNVAIHPFLPPSPAPGLDITSIVMIGMVALMGVYMITQVGKEFWGSEIVGSLPDVGQTALPQVTRRIKSAYLTNWQYGGYSFVDEDPGRPSELWVTGAADYVDPAEVINFAEREGLSTIHLAGGFWQQMGHQGYGQGVSISQAREILRQAKIHVLKPSFRARFPTIGRFPERESALRELGDYEVLYIHDDGDLTVRSRNKIYVVTTKGDVFEKVEYYTDTGEAVDSSMLHFQTQLDSAFEEAIRRAKKGGQ